MRSHKTKDRIVGWGAALVCTFLLFGCAPDPQMPADVYVRELDGNVFDTTPVRGEVRPLRLRRTDFEYRCAECHTDFRSPEQQNELASEHAAIYDLFSHGLNTRCVNCHNPADRETFVSRDGQAIPSTDIQLLCAQCHGPTYRDWEAGVHGRQNGYWNKEMGERTRLMCTQCHDPHSPKFPMMAPDAAPIYTRLQAQAVTGEGAH